MMSLSLIIPVYNEIKQLQVSIKKLPSLKRYFKNFEIIFVDDFSNDGTYNFLLKTSKKYKFIKIIKNKKKGLGSAINRYSQIQKEICLYSSLDQLTMSMI